MLTIKAAAELTGIPEATLRIWERRYGLGATHRTESGYRLYDSDSIAKLKAMQELIDSGWGASQAAHEVLANQEKNKGAGSGSSASSEITQYAQFQTLTTEFFQALSTLDQADLNSVLDRVFAKGSFEFVIDNWVVPTLQEVGTKWLTGESTIVMEHFASSSIMRRISALFEAAGQSNSGPRVLVGAPHESFHEIGILSFATAIRRRGLNTIYLGTNIPAESWAEAVISYQASAVAISVATKSDVKNAQSCVNAIRKSNRQIVISAGGPYAPELKNVDLVLNGNLIDSSSALHELLEMN